MVPQPDGLDATAIEQHGIDPVPPQERRVRARDLFALTANFQISPGMILIAGLAVSQGLSFRNGVIAVVGGMLTAVACYLVMATIGVDYGIPGQVATRMAYGIRGSRLVPSLLRSVASIYWFAFQTVAGSLAVGAVLQNNLHIHLPLIPLTLGFGLLQVIVAAVGYGMLKRLSEIALPLKLFVLIWLLAAMALHHQPGFAVRSVWQYAGHGSQWQIGILWFNTALGGWLTVITDAADFCRYSKSRRQMWIGTAAGSFAGMMLATVIGAYAAAATLGQDINPFNVVSGFRTGGLPSPLLLLVIILDNWTINGLNLYTGGLSLANIFDRMGRFRATLVVSCLGLALSVRPDLVTGYTHFVDALGSVFAPIAGVLMADYLLLHKMRIDVPSLFVRGGRYWFSKGFHLHAMVWTGIGALAGFLLPETWPAPILALLLSGLGYYGSVVLLRTIRRAPGEAVEEVEAESRRIAAT